MKKYDEALERQKKQQELERQADINRILENTVKENAYMQMLGMELMQLAPGQAVGRIKLRDEIMNPYGYIHGGCLYSLADVISGLAACAHGKYCSTVSGNMNYLKPARDTEYIYCRASQNRYGTHLAVFEVSLTNDAGTVLETGTFTFYVLNQDVLSQTEQRER